MSPDKQTPRRSKYISGSGGNGGPSDGPGEAAGGGDEDFSDDRLPKVGEDKVTNNGI